MSMSILLEIPEAVPKTSTIPECSAPPKNDQDEEAASIGEINFCLRYQSSIFSFKLPPPVDNISNLYQFHSSFRQRLLESGKCRSTEIQLNVWPLYTWNLSATVIGPRASGKTTAYVLALLNKFWLGGYIQPKMTADKMIPKSSPVFRSQRIFGSKIYAIILADSMLSVMQIGKEFQKWLRVLVGLPPREAMTDTAGTFTENDHELTAGGPSYRSHQRNQYSVRINQLHDKSPLGDYFDVLNGCAALITTAGALTKLIRMNLISINDNKVLIIDQADDFIHSGKEVGGLFSLATGKQNFLTNRQSLLLAQNWTENIKRFFFEVQVKPILVLKSLVDATILFQQARAQIELTETLSVEHVERIVSNLIEMPKFVPVIAAAICRDYEQMAEIAAHLRTSKHIDRDLLQLYTLKEQSTAIDNNDISVKLLTYNPNLHLVKLVLLTKDDILDFALYFRRFNCLIHFDRFEDPQDDFIAILNSRFVLIFDNLVGDFGEGTHGSEGLWQIQQLDQLLNPKPMNAANSLRQNKILNYFVLIRSDFTNKEQRFKHVVIDLLDYCDQVMADRRQTHKQNVSEQTGGSRYRDYMNAQMVKYIQDVIEAELCPQFAAFAKCKKMDQQIQCWKGRHTLHSNTFEPSSAAIAKLNSSLIEPNSQIKFRISHVVDTNQFYIQLLMCRSTAQFTGEWVPTNDHEQLSRLRELLARYKQMRHLTKFKVISNLVLGQIYAFFDYDDMLRVRLMKIHTSSAELPIWISPGRACKMSDDELAFFKLNVEVLAIDYGRTIYIKAYNLIELDPAHPNTELLLSGIPPLAYRIYLADVAAPEGEYSWNNSRLSNQASVFTDNMLLQMVGSSEENNLTGWILARNENILWLHRVVLSKRLHKLDVMQNTYLADNMIRNCVAIANDRRFVDCDYDAHRRVGAFWRSSIQRKLARFQRFDSCTEVPSLHHVFITKFVDIDQVYVIRQDQTDKLNRLEMKWAQELKQNIKSDHRSPVSVILHQGQLCFYLVNNQLENDKVQMEAKRCQIVSIDKAEQTCRIMFLDYGFDRSGIPVDLIYQIQDDQITSYPFQTIRINLHCNVVFEFTDEGKQSRAVIGDNLEKLSAVIQFDCEDAELCKSPVAEDDAIAKIRSFTSLDFARCYSGTMFVYQEDVDELDWRFASQRTEVSVAQLIEPHEDNEERYIYDEVPVHLIGFLMHNGFVHKTDNYEQLLAMRPSYKVATPLSDYDDDDQPSSALDGFGLNPKLTSQEKAEKILEMLRMLLEQPVERPHSDDVDGEAEETQKEQDGAPLTKPRVINAKRLSDIDEDEDEQLPILEGMFDLVELGRLLQNDDPEFVKALLLNPGDLDDEQEEEDFACVDSDLSDDEQGSTVNRCNDGLTGDSDADESEGEKNGEKELDLEANVDMQNRRNRRIENVQRIDDGSVDGYIDYDQFIPF